MDGDSPHESTGDLSTQFPGDFPEYREPERLSSRSLLWMSLWFEGGVAVLACLLAWLFGVDLPGSIKGSGAGWVAGLVWAGPLFGLFLVTYGLPWRLFREIRQFLEQTLGPALGEASHGTILLIALLAGGCEELLFRGVLHPLVGGIAASVLFGLVHAVTPVYAVLAALFGAVFSWQLVVTGDLMAPMVTHALYDWGAFLVLRRQWRRRRGATGSGEPTL